MGRDLSARTYRDAESRSAAPRDVSSRDYHRYDPTRYRLHHGGIHGEKAGAPRHDRGAAGLEKNLKLKSIRRPAVTLGVDEGVVQFPANVFD